MTEGAKIFLLSMILAVPLAIVANLLTPLISSQLERLRQKSRQNSVERLKKEYRLVKNYVDHRDEMYVGMTVAFLKVSVVTSFGALLSSSMATFGLFFIAGPITILFMIVALNIAMEALRLANRVRDFSAYHETVVKRLEKFNLDESILENED